jgi:glycosyltransferase involved in cell wall biosynthesis
LIKVIYDVFADASNTNAQSMNAREIALRLDTSRFVSTFFHAGDPDARLVGRPDIRLKRIPPRLGSLTMFAEAIVGRHDILFSPSLTRVGRLCGLSRKAGVGPRIVGTVESTMMQKGAVSRVSERKALAKYTSADRLYAITNRVADSMREKYGIHVDGVIPVGVDRALFGFCNRLHHAPPWKVLFVGSLQAHKQPDLILELADRFRDDPLEFHLVGGVIGDPSYPRNLMEEKERRDLSSVHFHGHHLQAEIKEYMADADVFVLPSRVEGLPKVTMEAAATGLPSIVFSDYRTPSVVDGETGFQVDTLDEMADRMKLLVDNRDLRLKMGEAAAQLSERFDWDLVARQWQEAFLSIAGRHA